MPTRNKDSSDNGLGEKRKYLRGFCFIEYARYLILPASVVALSMGGALFLLKEKEGHIPIISHEEGQPKGLYRK